MNTTDPERRRRFPVGAAVTLTELEDDPYPVYARLRALEPVSWISVLGIWYVTRYDDVRIITEGSDHARYRRGRRWNRG